MHTHVIRVGWSTLVNIVDQAGRTSNAKKAPTSPLPNLYALLYFELAVYALKVQPLPRYLIHLIWAMFFESWKFPGGAKPSVGCEHCGQRITTYVAR